MKNCIDFHTTQPVTTQEIKKILEVEFAIKDVDEYKYNVARIAHLKFMVISESATPPFWRSTERTLFIYFNKLYRHNKVTTIQLNDWGNATQIIKMIAKYYGGWIVAPEAAFHNEVKRAGTVQQLD